MAEFSRVTAEESAKQAAEKLKPTAVGYPGRYLSDAGMIAGTVVDASGGVIASATVTARNIHSEEVWATKTDIAGRYLLAGLAAGVYQVRFEANGFKHLVYVDVGVYVSKQTLLNVTLDVGSVSETVNITAESSGVQITSAQVSSLAVNSRRATALPNPGLRQEVATPRLRQYFPETLLWLPQLETDKQGRAQLKVKLDDGSS